MAGRLYLCPTPIGNLEDMPVRVLGVLKKVNRIAAEDTRNTLRLLNHFEIKTPMTSYHEHNKTEKAVYLTGLLQQGQDIAVVTDAGTPAISDPGEVLVRMCHEQGIQVVSLPGPCACVTALAASGQDTRRFCFEGFLPADKKARRQRLAMLEQETRTMVLYEAPHHLAATLEELFSVLGDRQMTVCRELTKLHEEYIMTTVGDALEKYRSEPPRGEYVLVIAGRSVSQLEEASRAKWDSVSLSEHMSIYEEQGMDRKEAMRQVAKDRGISRRDVYQGLL